MSDLAATAEKLRHVKEATRNFLTLWSLEQVRRRVREGRQQIESLDAASIEQVIRELDVHVTPALLDALSEGEK